MIARTWHGRVPVEKGNAYYAYIERTGLAEYRSTLGNRGIVVLVRTEAAVTHFTLTSFWDSLDAIKRFAGEEYTRAHYYPEDDQYLIEREPFVVHHDVVMADVPRV